MEEKIIIEGRKCNVKKIVLCVFVIPLIAALIMVGIGFNEFDVRINSFNNHIHNNSCYRYDTYYSSYTDYLWDSMIPYCRYSYFDTGEEYATQIFLENELVTSLLILGSGVLLCVLLFLLLNFYKITVTNKRIYGRLAFGKRVDLPIDFVTAISKIQALKGISISSSSKKAKFLLIKNTDEIYNEINKLLIERQSKARPVVISYPANAPFQMQSPSPMKAPVTAPEKKTDSPDDLIKFKELLDKDIISQEEYDAKKKQILGL